MNRMRKSIILSLVLLCCATAGLSAQITTASAYFKAISEYYASLKDYEVDFQITINKKETSGSLSFLAPNFVRMDYVEPANQVICFNGDNLTMYLPETGAVMQQEPEGASAKTSMGLSLLSRYYTVSYESGQAAVPLDEYRRMTLGYVKFEGYGDDNPKFKMIVGQVVPNFDIFQ